MSTGYVKDGKYIQTAGMGYSGSGMPDWENAKKITFDEPTVYNGYIAPADGYLVGYMNASVAECTINVYINGVFVGVVVRAAAGGIGYIDIAPLQVPVSKGDKLTFEVTTGNGVTLNNVTGNLSFVPLKAGSSSGSGSGSGTGGDGGMVTVYSGCGMPDWSRAVNIGFKTSETAQSYTATEDGYIFGSAFAYGSISDTTNTKINEARINNIWVAGSLHKWADRCDAAVVQIPVSKDDVFTLSNCYIDNIAKGYSFVPFKAGTGSGTGGGGSDTDSELAHRVTTLESEVQALRQILNTKQDIDSLDGATAAIINKED